MVTESGLKSDAEKAAEYAAKEVQAATTDVSKVSTEVKSIETKVSAADVKATSWVKANAGKVVAGAAVLAVLLALHFVWKLI